MADPISPQVQLEKTYNAAADHYDHPGVAIATGQLWNAFHTVHLLLKPPIDALCWDAGSQR